jgi:deazaflavin-dependent oxidoreductase (nitroreductase family)
MPSLKSGAFARNVRPAYAAGLTASPSARARSTSGRDVEAGGCPFPSVVTDGYLRWRSAGFEADAEKDMDEQIRRALARDRTIDITTSGRHSGQPQRIEIWFHNLDGAVYITGLPGKRDWYANLLANPDFTFHLKGDVVAKLSARATPITDSGERRNILTRILANLGRSVDLDAWLARSPLVAVTLTD